MLVATFLFLGFCVAAAASFPAMVPMLASFLPLLLLALCFVRRGTRSKATKKRGSSGDAALCLVWRKLFNLFNFLSVPNRNRRHKTFLRSASRLASREFTTGKSCSIDASHVIGKGAGTGREAGWTRTNQLTFLCLSPCEALPSLSFSRFLVFLSLLFFLPFLLLSPSLLSPPSLTLSLASCLPRFLPAPAGTFGADMSTTFAPSPETSTVLCRTTLLCWYPTPTLAAVEQEGARDG